jgi:cyclopropane fatty-acyl-phospholipid synthase-like methyltransferase
MNYTDEDLKNHELKFWINSYEPPFIHLDFYREFFNFSELSKKKTIDIGCGGAPISDYCDVHDINLTLISDLVKNPKFSHLSKYKFYSNSLFDLNESGYEYLVCLNVIDHFNDESYSFIDKFHSFLKDDGIMWLYYDVRDKNDGNHLRIDNLRLIEKMKSKFEILKMDNTINPKHSGWSSVNKSIRIIAKKNGKNN